ncbi:photosystem II assembly protein Psb34 [Acaryochloris marina]|uniref:Conserved domain protein n=1 Tax=Acaryochloris marina (strain MBIC 11017) TaxID=329726 RepID=B0C389_ACAM1|nr:ssl1498 family light-harvesting-like protein [Acaryochloris marina]ABW28588.1 conserved domain protein [Acaryochloris marina MBIC11017]
MPYTTEDRGLVNNFAVEPKSYAAEPASDQKKTLNMALTVGGVLLVVGLCAFAATLS